MGREKSGSGSSALIIKTSSIGDIIHTFPVVRALKKGGVARIDWVVNREYESLVRMSPYVDDVVPFSRKEIGAFWRSAKSARLLKNFIGAIRRKEYDSVIDLQGLLRSALITCCARGKKKLGFSDAREGAPFFYTTKIGVSEGKPHAIDRLMSALATLGIDERAVAYDLAPPAAAEQKAEKLMGEGRFVAINPNARWRTKLWDSERYAEVGRAVIEQFGATPTLVGGSDEMERGAKIAAAIGPGALDLTGRGDLPFLAAVLKKCGAMVTNDSGPLHLAVAMGTPVIGLYGPTNPDKIGPYGAGHTAIRAGADCSPCRRRQCSVAPLCIDMIEIGKVINALASTLTPAPEK